MSLNKVMIIGNLGRDPEMRYTPSGQAVTQFTVAVNRNFKGQDGAWQEETEWFRVVAWAQLAERSAENLRKGMKVYIEGRLQTRQWEDQQGQKRYTTELIANQVTNLDRRPREEGADAPPFPGESRPAAASVSPTPAPGSDGCGRHALRHRRPPLLIDCAGARRTGGTASTGADTMPPAARKKRDDYYRDRRRRKVCAFCADKTVQIDYKEVSRLRRYLSERAKIEPRRKTGTCAAHQRELSVALKRARLVALLPYAPQHLRP